MLECARSLLGEFAKQRIVDVGEFYQCHVRCESEQFLYHEQQRINQQDDYAVDGKVEEYQRVYVTDILQLRHLESGPYQTVRYEYEQAGTEYLRAL